VVCDDRDAGDRRAADGALLVDSIVVIAGTCERPPPRLELSRLGRGGRRATVLDQRRDAAGG